MQPAPRHQDHNPQPAPWFTGAELRALFKAVVDGTASEVTDGELHSFVRWARGRARVEQTLLEMVLAGEVVARWGPDDWLFELRERRAS
jgi:hypothetical protein